MSIRYYDRLNRFGIEFDTKYGSRLIFPEEYYPDFVSRYHFDPFKFRYFTQQFMSEPTLFLSEVLKDPGIHAGDVRHTKRSFVINQTGTQRFNIG